MAKKSKLNKKLPKASSIRWCTGAGKNMCTAIATDESRKYSRQIRFKQPSGGNGIGWQIVYKWRNRYTPSVAKSKKATWSGWSTWRTPTECSVKNESGVLKTYAAKAKVPARDYWLRGNLSYGKSNVYRWIMTFASSIPSSYDAVQFQFAIRSFKPSTCQHGSWVYQNLYVYRKATIADEVLVKTSSGGLQLDFNYICERGGYVVVNSIKDADGEELLKNTIKQAAATDTNRVASVGTEDLDWYPYKRDGYTAGQLTISDSLKRSPEYGETLTVDAYYLTKNNCKTPFAFKNNGYVYGGDQVIPQPTVKITKDENRGLITVTASRNAAITEYLSQFDNEYEGISSIGCTASYVVEETKKSVTAYGKNIAKFETFVPETIFGQWEFKPPVGVDITFTITIKNAYEQGTTTKVIDKIDFKGGYILSGVTNPDIYAAVMFNTSFNTETETPNSVNLPYGRSLPFAVYGTGRTTSMSLKGSCVTADKVVTDSDDVEHCYKNNKEINKFSTPKYIKKLAKNLGVYTLRSSQGEIFKVALNSVDIEYVTDELITVSLDMEEVS